MMHSPVCCSLMTQLVALLADLGHLSTTSPMAKRLVTGRLRKSKPSMTRFSQNHQFHPRSSCGTPDLLGAEQAPAGASFRRGRRSRCPIPSGTALGTSVLTQPRLGLVQIAQNFSHSNLSSDTVPAGGGHGIVSEMMFPGFLTRSSPGWPVKLLVGCAAAQQGAQVAARRWQGRRGESP